MKNEPGKGKLLTPEQLASLLRHAADEVERTASIEGSIAWAVVIRDFS